MKTAHAFLALYISGCAFILSQNCFSQDLEFTSQVQIDNFQLIYPGCTNISGDVNIEGEDISNLLGLITVTSIEGTLCIKKNPHLFKLAGLENLRHVENLMIINNDALTSLHGLEALDTINGYLHIWYNDSIRDLRGLDSINYIGADLMIEGNYALRNCHGLENLRKVGDNLVIGCIAGWMHHHRSIKSLNGFNNLCRVGGMLWINCNDSITNLKGLENLVSVGNGLIINGNKCLKNLNGLEQLKTCGGRIIIGGWWEDCQGNPCLSNIEGIKNLEHKSIAELRIRQNFALSDCNIKSICEYLLKPEAIVVITNNAAGCNSVEEVKDACASFGVKKSQKSPLISVYPNPISGSGSGSCSITIVIDSPYNNIHLSCYNALGLKLHAKEIRGNKTRLNILGWEPGIYVLLISSDAKPLASTRFVIK